MHVIWLDLLLVSHCSLDVSTYCVTAFSEVIVTSAAGSLIDLLYLPIASISFLPLLFFLIVSSCSAIYLIVIVSFSWQ